MSAQAVTELGFPLDIVETMEASGRWPDLTRLEARNPALLNGVVWLLAHQTPVKAICEALSVSPCTVNAVRHHPKYGVAVVSKTESIRSDLEFVLLMKSQELRELAMEGRLPNMFDTKLAFDMYQLLSGGATQRVEVIESKAEREASEFFEQARRGSGMVFDAEILPPTADSPISPVLPNTSSETGDY